MGLGISRPRPRPTEPTFHGVVDAAVGVPVTVPVIDGVAPGEANAPATTNVQAHDEANAPATDVSAAPLTLTISAEKTALSSDAEHTLLTMLSLKAPPAPVEVQRPPIDLVAVIDRSGSMGGEKMNLMKQTLELLVKRGGLNEGDRISLVSFDREVKLELPLTPMDAPGRTSAEAVVKRLQPGSTTNLSGGALKAIDVLDASAEPRGIFGGGAGKGGRTRAIMLFTDGLANEGIKHPAALQAAVASAASAAAAKLGGPISLFTFGFGRDHNENCLRELATTISAGGLYYYVKSVEDIPNAFADCLGGLTSVVAQNATLSLEPTGAGVSVVRVLGSTYKRDASGAIALGDLFAEDQKDILVEIKLPKLQRAVEPGAAAPVLRAALRAFNVVRGAPEVAEAVLEIGRPATTPADQPFNEALDAQRNRILVAEAIEDAARLADAGELVAGRQRLEACRTLVAESGSADNALSYNLQTEVATLSSNYRTVSQYRSVGSKMSKMSATSHQRQRANHSQVDMYGGGAKRKAAMKASWLSSISSSGAGGNDSDSD